MKFVVLPEKNTEQDGFPRNFHFLPLLSARHFVNDEVSGYVLMRLHDRARLIPALATDDAVDKRHSQ